MKVHFFQDNSFFRTKEGTNPFFDPIIRVCEENGIEWKVWTTNSTKKCGYDKSHVGYLRTINFLWTWYWRAHRILNKKADPELLQLRFGKIMRLFYGKKLKADLFVTIAGNQRYILSDMFPNVRNVDLQHGVIYSTHNGYFTEDRRLRKVYQEMKNCEFWLYGKGYADCFFKHPENAADLNGRVHIIGDVVRADRASNKLEVDAGGRNIIAFSSQLTPDFDDATLKLMVERTVKFFEEKHAQYGDKCRYVIKQHPRFNNVCNIGALKALPYLEHSSELWSELFPKMKIHATFSSTVCFDAASAGVPTEFVPFEEELILDGRYYVSDYCYPGMNSTREQIFSWYRSCYSQFSKERCLKLLKGEI